MRNYKTAVIVLVATAVILAAISMRYQSKYFKDFSGGEGQKFLTEDKSQYHASSKIQVSRLTKKIALQRDLTSNNLAFSMVNRNVASDGTYIYTLVSDSGTYKLYRSSDGETWSLRFTFGATYTDNSRMGYYNGILFIFFGGGTGYIATSTDAGASWSYNAGKPIENNQLMVSYFPVLGDYLYYEYGGGSGPTIVKTKDFVTVSTVYAFGEDVDMEQTVEFDGFIYFVVDNTLYRLEYNKAVKVRSFHGYPTIIPLGPGAMAVMVRGTDYVRTLIYDGAEFTEFERLEGYTSATPLFEAEGFGYFTLTAAGPTYDIFKIDGEGRIFKEYTNVGAIEIGLRFKDYDVFLTYGNTAKKAENYVLAGTIDLPIVDEGEIIPVGLAVRHKPLTNGAAVNLYVKKDQATSWGSAVLANSTANSVKKRYKYPNAGSVVDFFQIRAELTTNSASYSPEDVSVEFLYLPAGLKNAK